MVGSALAALGWGAVLAGLLQGVPIDTDGHVAGMAHLATPFVAATGLALLTLVAAHGATFLALRLPADRPPGDRPAGPPAARPARSPRSPRPPRWACSPTGYARRPCSRCPPYCCWWRWSGRWWRPARRCPGGGRGWPWPPPARPSPCRWLWSARRSGPAVLVSTVDPAATLGVTDAAASGPTLRLLGWLLLPLLPALLGFQAMCWWVFRGRIDGRAPVYW